jgi:hypothetical protein
MTGRMTPAMQSIARGEILSAEALRRADDTLRQQGINPLQAFTDDEANRHHRAIALAHQPVVGRLKPQNSHHLIVGLLGEDDIRAADSALRLAREGRNVWLRLIDPRSNDVNGPFAYEPCEVVNDALHADSVLVLPGVAHSHLGLPEQAIEAMSLGDNVYQIPKMLDN